MKRLDDAWTICALSTNKLWFGEIMFNANEYLSSITGLLIEVYGKRLYYVGLQGSYLRGEATEESDIDIMVVVKDITVSDLDEYRRAIATLEDFDKSCGFICGTDDLKNWNPLEICHLLHTTEDYYGKLSELVPSYTEQDVRSFVKMSLGNLYHEICHRYIHSSRERNVDALPFTYKSVFFILQNLYYLENRVFIGTKKELLTVLDGKDKQVLKAALSFTDNADYNFEEKFNLLFSWCKETLRKI